MHVHYNTRLDYILLQTLMFLFDSILVSLEFSDICRKYEVCTGYRYYSMESIRKRFLFICFDASKNSPVCFTQSVVFLTSQLMNKNFQALCIVWCFIFHMYWDLHNKAQSKLLWKYIVPIRDKTLQFKCQ